MMILIKRWLAPTGTFFRIFWKVSLLVFSSSMILITLSTAFSIESTWVPLQLLNNIALVSLAVFVTSKLSVDPDKVKPGDLPNMSVKEIIAKFLT